MKIHAFDSAVRWSAGLLLLLALLPCAAHGQLLTAKYSRVHDASPPGGADDSFAGAATDPQGNMMVAANSIDSQRSAWVVMKYSADGNIIWQKRLADAHASALAVDAAGNVIVTGDIFLGYSGNPKDYCTAKYSGGDGALLWQRRYNGPANGVDSAVAVKVDRAGDVIVTGSSKSGGNDYYTIKYKSADGAVVWEKRSGGGVDAWSEARGLAVDAHGNVVVTGKSNNGANDDFLTFKYASGDGAVMWERRYNGPANGGDGGYAVAVDASGNAVVTGSTFDGTSENFYTAKYRSADGGILWEKHYDGPAGRSDRAAAVTVDSRGDFIVAGPSTNKVTEVTGTFSIPSLGFYHVAEYHTVKYAGATGEPLWERNYGRPAPYGCFAEEVAVDSHDNVIVTGLVTPNPGNDTDFDEGGSIEYYTIKYAGTDGVAQWEKGSSAPKANAFDSVSLGVDRSDRVIVAGSQRATSNFDGYTMHLEADGKLKWEKGWDGPVAASDFGQAVAFDSSGYFTVAGKSNVVAYSPNGTSKYAYIARHRPNGAVLWEQYLPDRTAEALVLDKAENVVVAGSFGPGYTSDFMTAKFAARSGVLLWEKRYNGPAGTDFAEAVTVDRQGNVIVTGTSWNYNAYTSEEPDYWKAYTIKYAGADGTVLWAKRSTGATQTNESAKFVAADANDDVVIAGYSGSGGYIAKHQGASGVPAWEVRLGIAGAVRGMALDTEGNVIVTGDTPPNTANSDIYTAKFAAGSGALLWRTIFAGEAGKQDYGSGVTIDSGGNVIITGTVGTSSAPAAEAYVAKYAGTNGSMVWERRRSGGTGSRIAIDESGRVVVAGTTSSGGQDDLYTAIHATVDGTLLGEATFDGPAHGADIVKSMATGPFGTVALTGSAMTSTPGGFTYDFETVLFGPPANPAIDYSKWMQAYGLTGTAASFDADEDSDGLTNGVEFAFNLDPTRPETTPVTPGKLAGLPITRLTQQPGGGTRLTLEFLCRRYAGAGVSYTAQFSSSLGPKGWSGSASAPVIVPVDETWDRVTVTDTMDFNSATRRFGRVVVSLP